MKQAREFTSEEVEKLTGVSRAILNNWVLRGFAEPSRAERLGKRKHKYFFSYRELFWILCLNVLAMKLTMEYKAALAWKKIILDHAAPILDKEFPEGWMLNKKYERDISLPLDFPEPWYKDPETKRHELMSAAGWVVLHLHFFKKYLDDKVEAL